MQGSIEGYAATGAFMHRASISAASVTSALFVGTTLWLGFEDGTVVAFDTRAQQCTCTLPAHADAVIALAQCGLFVYSLSRAGAISAHSAAAPQVAAAAGDAGRAARQAWREAVSDWQARLGESSKLATVTMRVVTWNVGESRPKLDALRLLACGNRCDALTRELSGPMLVNVQDRPYLCKQMHAPQTR